MIKKNSKAFKKLIREHMARTGMKYEAAMRDLERKSTPDQGRTLAELLTALSAPRAALVMLSDVPAVGVSPHLEIARQHPQALARLRLRKAESGQAGAIVSRLEEERLIRAGAADGNTMKIIRAFATDKGTTFSSH